MIATGTSGHASVPLKDNPVTHLADAISKISTYEAPVQFNSVTRAYFDGLAPIEDPETGKWIRALQSSDRAEHAVRFIADANPTWNAMLRDTSRPRCCKRESGRTLCRRKRGACLMCGCCLET